MSNTPTPGDLADAIAKNQDANEPETGNPEPAGDTQNDDGFKSADSKRALLRDLYAERDARKTLQARIDAIEAEKLTDLEKAQRAAEDATREAAEARREALRYRLAATYGVSTERGEDGEPSDAELFLTGDTEEAMKAQAERFAARKKERDHEQLIKGLEDPNQGGGTTQLPARPGVPRLAAAFDSEIRHNS